MSQILADISCYILQNRFFIVLKYNIIGKHKTIQPLTVLFLLFVGGPSFGGGENLMISFGKHKTIQPLTVIFLLFVGVPRFGGGENLMISFML